MKFCPKCGAKLQEGAKFCPECGQKLINELPETSNDISNNEEFTVQEFSTYMYGLEGSSKSISKNFSLSIPQMKYVLTNERLIIEKLGVVSSDKSEIELFKINDVSVKQNIKDKVMGVGDIIITSSDSDTPKLTLKRIKDPLPVKEKIRSTSKDLKNKLNLVYKRNI